MLEPLQTVLHTYYFDTRNKEEGEAYARLVERLTAQGLRCMKSWGGQGHYHFVEDLDGKEITLDPRHLFENQWNTMPIEGRTAQGLRVFDWAEDYPINFREAVKRGHYLDLTPAMREVRRDTGKCRYCGHQESLAKGYVFCPACLDSEYLTEKDLPLTRMKAIDDRSDCAPLTEAERAHLLPLYQAAQLHGTTARGKKRLTDRRERIEREYQASLHAARMEHDGWLWLMDHGINTDNVIYYKHTDTFSFGWRHPLDAGVKSQLLDVLVEFPFTYELK